MARHLNCSPFGGSVLLWTPDLKAEPVQLSSRRVSETPGEKDRVARLRRVRTLQVFWGGWSRWLRLLLDNQGILPVDKRLVGFGVKVPVEDSELVFGEGLELVSKVGAGHRQGSYFNVFLPDVPRVDPL